MSDIQTTQSEDNKTDRASEGVPTDGLSNLPAHNSSDWASTTLAALGPIVETDYPTDRPPKTSYNALHADEDNQHIPPSQFDVLSKSNSLPPVEGEPSLAKFAASNEPEAFKLNTPTFEEYAPVGGEPGLSTATTTPGVEVPGSFPGLSSKNTQPSTLADDVQYMRDMVVETIDYDAKYMKDVTTNALEKAREYATKTADTVGGYLPPGVAAYLPRSPEQSQNPHVDSDTPKLVVATTFNETPDAGSRTTTPEPRSMTPSELDSPVTADTDEPMELLSTNIKDAANESGFTSKLPFESSRNTPHVDQPFEPGAMTEGLSRITEKTEESHQSPQTPHEAEPLFQVEDPSPKAEGEDINYHVTLASSDASTRSLVGTQVHIGSTPGASLFTSTGKESTYCASEPNESDHNGKSTGGSHRYSVSDAIRDEYDAAHRLDEAPKEETASGIPHYEDKARTEAVSKQPPAPEPECQAQPIPDSKEAASTRHEGDDVTSLSIKPDSDTFDADVVEPMPKQLNSEPRINNHETHSELEKEPTSTQPQKVDAVNDNAESSSRLQPQQRASEPARDLAMSHDFPVTDGRQYTTAVKERQGEGAPFHMHTPHMDPTSPSASQVAHAHKFSGDSGMIDSTRATPGHGVPIAAPKAAPHDTDSATTPSAKTVNGSISTGEVSGGKPVAGAPQGVKEVKDAARGELKPTPKKHGFFHKLKGGLRALGGRHDGEHTK